MVLAIGLVVDDAIVVVENVERQLERDLAPVRRRRCRDAGSHRPDHRHDGWLAVFVPVASAWCHRAGGEPVRADNRDLGRHLGIQFARPQPGFVCRVATASAAVALAGIPRLQRRFHLCRAGVRKWHPTCHRRALGCAGAVRGWPGAYLRDLCAHSGGLPAGRGSGLLLRGDPASGRRLAATHRGCRGEGSDYPGGAGRCDGCDSGHRHEFPDRRQSIQFGGGIRAAQAMGRARREAHRIRIVAAVRPKLLAIPDAIALSFDPPAIPGIATTGGFEFEVEDLTGQGAQGLNDATQALLAEARKQPELDARQLFSTFSTSTPEYNSISTGPRRSCLASASRTYSTRCRSNSVLSM